MIGTAHPPFAAVVLCGGGSRRMGTDKAFLPFRGTSLLAHQLETLRSLGPAQLLVSGRAGVDYPTDSDCDIVVDPVPDLGPVAGIHAALRHCRHPHLLVLAVDIPLVSVSLIAGLLDARTPTQGAVFYWNDRPEPLVAVYPREALAVAGSQLDGGALRARDFVCACEAASLLKRIDMDAERADLLENWNRPSDLPPWPSELRGWKRGSATGNVQHRTSKSGKFSA